MLPERDEWATTILTLTVQPVPFPGDFNLFEWSVRVHARAIFAVALALYL
jgi:hypothetical protein